jgi:hypothetical protein
VDYQLTQSATVQAGGNTIEFEISDPPEFALPPNLAAFRDMVERRIPDPQDPDRVTAYHLLKWYKQAMRRLDG